MSLRPVCSNVHQMVPMHTGAECHPEQRERICVKRGSEVLASFVLTAVTSVSKRSFRVAQDDNLLMEA